MDLDTQLIGLMAGNWKTMLAIYVAGKALAVLNKEVPDNRIATMLNNWIRKVKK